MRGKVPGIWVEETARYLSSSVEPGGSFNLRREPFPEVINIWSSPHPGCPGSGKQTELTFSSPFMTHTLTLTIFPLKHVEAPWCPHAPSPRSIQDDSAWRWKALISLIPNTSWCSRRQSPSQQARVRAGEILSLWGHTWWLIACTFKAPYLETDIFHK